VKPAPSQRQEPLFGSTAQDTALLRGLAGLHFSYGRYPDAESLLDLALWLNPGDRSTHVMMARVLVRQRRVVEARNHMGKARNPRANV
jgi:Flp pilus assembly protein TadD